MVTKFDVDPSRSRDKGTFAANCLLARRMAERGVRFIQLYHNGWDHHQDGADKGYEIVLATILVVAYRHGLKIDGIGVSP